MSAPSDETPPLRARPAYGRAQPVVKARYEPGRQAASEHLLQLPKAKDKVASGAGAFLPMTAAELEARGWDAVDVVFVTGDAYIDHPSFAMALLGRVLEASDHNTVLVDGVGAVRHGGPGEDSGAGGGV